MDQTLWLQATWQEVVATSPLAFVVGVAVGFVLANRYRITRRNGKGDDRTDDMPNP